MHVEIKEAVREYHVTFKLNKSKKFRKGPNKGWPRTVTTCTIWILADPQPTNGKLRISGLAGKGVTTLGSRDEEDSLVACKYALERALDDAKLGKAANALFWQEFHERHRRLDSIRLGKVSMACDEALDGSGPSTCQHKVVPPCRHRVKAKGNGQDWCAKHIRACDPAYCDDGPVRFTTLAGSFVPGITEAVRKIGSFSYK